MEATTLLDAGPDPEAEPTFRSSSGAPLLVEDLLQSRQASRFRPAAAAPPPSVAAAIAAVVRTPQTAGAALVAVGLLVLLTLGYVYGFTALSQARTQHSLLQQLTAEPATAFDLASGSAPKGGAPVGVLRIPALRLDQVIVQGSTADDLRKGPGHMATTPLPGQPGNAVLAGRRASYGAPFGGLGRLHAGDTVEVVDGYGTFTYIVARVVTVQIGQQDVIGSSTRTSLTLVTASSGWFPSGRLAVVAYPEGTSASFAAAPTFNPPSTQLGLQGDDAFGYLALLWATVFVALAIGAVWALQRVEKPSVVYLLVAPALLAAGLFFCESLCGLLPATL